MEWISEIGVAFLCLICAGVFFASVSFFYRAGVNAGEQLRQDQLDRLKKEVRDDVIDLITDRLFSIQWTQMNEVTQCQDVFPTTAEDESKSVPTGSGM